MVNRQHYSAKSLLKKTISVTLVMTILLSMVIIGNVFGTASAAEVRTDGDYTYEVLGDGTARITRFSGTQSQVTIPGTLSGVSVTEIGYKAFENNDNIESVTFSEGITTIRDEAFSGCDLLENVNFSATVTSIGKDAFQNCRALQSVDIPSTLKTIDDRAFRNCPILTDITLHEGLETMGNRFLAGTPVSEIYIPSTVTMANEAFAEANLLETVTFADGITEIPNDMFEDNNSIRELTIPDTVTKLGRDSLAQMGSLESIVIPDSVTEMGDYVLFECPNLSSATIGKGVTAIPYCAFTNCPRLTEITIPSNVTSIGNDAFSGCTRLSSATFNEGLVNIGSYSFAKTAITEVTLPASVKSGDSPFNECTRLKKINLSENADTIVRGLFQNTAVESAVIPEGVTVLSERAFKYCKSLTEVSLPSNLKTIEPGAFEGCSAITKIDVPKSVKTIDQHAFYNTSSLNECTFREGLQTLGNNLFEGSALTSIYIPKTLSSTNSPLAGSNITDVTFSNGIGTLTDSLLKGAGKLTKVTIPDTVINIGKSCFRETNIQSIVIPDNVKTIGSSAFEECNNLYAVKFGAGIRKLPQWCFYGCDVLQNVVIPETVRDMEPSVFENSGLSYQKLPQSIRYIPNSTFKDCKKLTTVECSDSLENIGDYAFERCENLTTLKTSAKDVEFNNTTFKDCPKFTDARFYVFNPANTGIESTGNIGTDHTLVHFTVKYDIRDDWKNDEIQMNRLYLSIPNNLDIVNNSFSAEGFNFNNAEYTGDYKNFDLTGGKPTGELRFSAYLNNTNDSINNFGAEVEFHHNGTYFRKPLGEVQFSTAKLSLFAPSKVTEKKITVSGYSASPDKDVTVYITRLNKDGSKGDAVSYTVSPNKYTGKYISEELNILPDGKNASKGDKFEVYAECSGARSDVVTFIYTPGALKVVEAIETVNIKKFLAPFTTNLSHQNQANTYDITGIFTKGTSPVVMINPAEMLQFKFRFENDENISNIVLMSHKGSEWRFMELFYDAESDMWIGEGYFNIPDHELVPGQSYVPGALNLFYITGERKDTYRSHYYGNKSNKENSPVGDPPKPYGDEEVFYYDADGKPHGDLGDYHETGRDTVINILIDIVKGDWTDAASEAVTGGLHTLWQWGNENDNFFSFTHGGVRIGPDGLPILPGDPDMYNHNPEKDGKQRNAIDPSGTVYEAVKGNPVEGATAIIYKLNEDTGEWQEWNAADFEQQNPLLTNDEGAYAWFTDEGKFKVTVSKDGYEPQTSEVFEIPPEKLGLDFNLVDKTTHPTASVTKDEKTGNYTLKFSKFMIPDTVNTDTVKIEGLTDVSIVPVYLSEGDEFADTFTISGKRQQKEIKVTVTDSAKSYSGVTAEKSSETVTESTIPGDVTGDGKVTIDDATEIQKYLADLTDFTPEQIEAADTYGDGIITIDDATMIQKLVAGMIDSF